MLPTQVDLPPGNGRGIHLFQMDRTTGAMKVAGNILSLGPILVVIQQNRVPWHIQIVELPAL